MIFGWQFAFRTFNLHLLLLCAIVILLSKTSDTCIIMHPTANSLSASLRQTSFTWTLAPAGAFQTCVSSSFWGPFGLSFFKSLSFFNSLAGPAISRHPCGGETPRKIAPGTGAIKIQAELSTCHSLPDQGWKILDN